MALFGRCWQVGLNCRRIDGDISRGWKMIVKPRPQRPYAPQDVPQESGEGPCTSARGPVRPRRALVHDVAVGIFSVKPRHLRSSLSAANVVLVGFCGRDLAPDQNSRPLWVRSRSLRHTSQVRFGSKADLCGDVPKADILVHGSVSAWDSRLHSLA